MITNYELDEINRMSVEDPGMKDLLDRLHEYYLLKRPTPIPRSDSAQDMLNRIRARQMVAKEQYALQLAEKSKPTLKELAALFSTQEDASDET